MKYQGKVGFAVGTGRCGTLFLYQLIDKEPLVASSHERNPDNEAFHRYSKWHDLPVDDEGFLTAKEKEIRSDLSTHAYSFEASPYLSLSAKVLHERFGAKFILLLRRPDRVVTSFAHKGFYRHPYAVADVDLATGYQGEGMERMHNFFARIAPRGAFLRTWNDMSQVGRVAWFWRAWNERTIEHFNELPEDSYRIVRIEDLDYQRYIDLSRFLGYEAQVTQAEFDALSASKPHAFWRKRNIDQWNDVEIREFEEQVGSLAKRLGYEYRIERLVADARAEREHAMRLGHIPSKQTGPRFWRVRHGMASWLRRVGSGLRDMADGLDAR